MTALGIAASTRSGDRQKLDRAVKFGAGADIEGKPGRRHSGSLTNRARPPDHPPRRVGVEPRAPLAGLADAPLTDARRAAGARAGRRARRRRASRPAVVHCSDLGRARQTAEIIADALGAGVSPTPGFRERCGGDWEGHTSDEIERTWPGHARGLAAGRARGAARRRGRRRRVRPVRRRARRGARRPGTPAMVVTHGGVLRLIATRAGVDVARADPEPRRLLVRRSTAASWPTPEPLAPLASATELPTAE